MAPVAALRTTFFLNLAFVVVEVAGGWWTNSIAVLTDAVHDAGDALVLGVAWYLQTVARRGSDERYTYGYARYSMLGGWLASLVLIAGALFMIGVAAPRLNDPVVPHAPGMMLLAVFGMAMNGYAAWRLHRGSTLNERGVYLHLLEDVLGWAAVLVGGAIIHFTGWAMIDPLLSIAIGLYILWNAIGTLRHGTAILMQAHPPGIDAEGVRTALMAIDGVRGLSDFHTWSLDGRYVVGSVHLVVDTGELDAVRRIKAEARHALMHQGIGHATIELEWPGEPPHEHP
jgi:cobalt-zinc-cadmium efflux system protein